MKSFFGLGPAHGFLCQWLLTTIVLSICVESEADFDKKVFAARLWQVLWHLWKTWLSLSRLLLCAVTQLHDWKALCTLSLRHQIWIAKHYYCYGSNYFKNKKRAVTHGRNALGGFLLILIAAFSWILIFISAISCTLCFTLHILRYY